MRFMPAALAATGVFLAVGAARAPQLLERVGAYLRPPRRPVPADRGALSPGELRLRHAGLDWTAATLAARRLAAGAVGAFAGALAAQGDLFVAGSGRSVPGLMLLGAAGGVLALSVWTTQRRERRAEALRRELPTVADALALNVLAGSSVARAIEAVAAAARGVVSAELQRVAENYRTGMGMTEALLRASRETAHPDATRLYDMLGAAHDTGGRLAEALAELATDYRAGLARDLTTEGGKRALAVYGPILGLMIPVALLFLMYPTLVGLRALSQGP